MYTPLPGFPPKIKMETVGACVVQTAAGLASVGALLAAGPMRPAHLLVRRAWFASLRKLAMRRLLCPPLPQVARLLPRVTWICLVANNGIAVNG